MDSGLTSKGEATEDVRQRVRQEAHSRLDRLLDLAEANVLHGEAILTVHHNHGIPRDVRQSLVGKIDN